MSRKANETVKEEGDEDACQRQPSIGLGQSPSSPPEVSEKPAHDNQANNALLQPHLKVLVVGMTPLEQGPGSNVLGERHHEADARSRYSLFLQNRPVSRPRFPPTIQEARGEVLMLGQQESPTTHNC